jgi:hypothetical protein
MIFEVKVLPAAVGRRRIRPVSTIAPADSALSAVTRLGERDRRIREQLAVAMREAATMGHSLRAIAEAAGVSHEEVRRILGKLPRS